MDLGKGQSHHEGAKYWGMLKPPPPPRHLRSPLLPNASGNQGTGPTAARAPSRSQRPKAPQPPAPRPRITSPMITAAGIEARARGWGPATRDIQKHTSPPDPTPHARMPVDMDLGRRETTRQPGMTRRVDFAQDSRRPGMSWHGMAWHGVAWHDMVCHGKPRHGMAWPCKARQEVKESTT